MRISVLIATVVSSAFFMTAAFAQSSSKDDSTQTRKRYLPEYTESGDLILPKNFHEWVYVGSPLTPNGLNGGKANFPEFHNVYIEPGSYAIYKKTGEFPGRNDPIISVNDSGRMKVIQETTARGARACAMQSAEIQAT